MGSVCFYKERNKIGYLPSDARDASTILKGEPIRGTIVRLMGGTNWFFRFFLRKIYIGVIVKLEKGHIDWERFNDLSQKVKPLDDAVREALDLDKFENRENAIDAYKAILEAIDRFNSEDRYASAHRKCIAPVNRVTFLLEKGKNMMRLKILLKILSMCMTLYGLIKKEREAIIERYHRILEVAEK